jgi:hypothetical protein
MGVACGILALVAIFAGKLLAVQFSLPGQIREEFAEANAEWLTQEYHEELSGDAADLAGLSSEEDYPEFMVSHAYTEIEDADQLAPEDIDAFKQKSVPYLERLHREQPTYDEW